MEPADVSTGTNSTGGGPQDWRRIPGHTKAAFIMHTGIRNSDEAGTHGTTRHTLGAGRWAIGLHSTGQQRNPPYPLTPNAVNGVAFQQRIGRTK